MTTICYFHTGFYEVNLADEVDSEGFGVAKLTVPVSTENPLAISLYQISSRFKEVDDFRYGKMKLMIFKIVD